MLKICYINLIIPEQSRFTSHFMNLLQWSVIKDVDFYTYLALFDPFSNQNEADTRACGQLKLRSCNSFNRDEHAP